MISDANQMVAELSRPEGCSQHLLSFPLSPWKLTFSESLIPQGLPLFHTMWLPDVRFTLSFTSKKDCSHTK